MTRDETKKLLMIISQFYSSFRPANLSFATDAWYAVIGVHDYKVMEKAVMDYVNTNTSGFAPVPAQLIELAYKQELDKDRMTAQEAWNLVLNAMKRSAYYYEEEFAKLPKNVQRSIGSAGRLRSMAIDENFNPGVEFSFFQRTYQDLESKTRDEHKQLMIEGAVNDKARLADIAKDTQMEIRRQLPGR